MMASPNPASVPNAGVKPQIAVGGQPRPLRPRQQDVINDLREAFSHGRRAPMVQAPCGFGKTVLAAHIVTGARSKGLRVAFAVPMLSLIEQSFTRFQENGIDAADMGICQGDHPWRRPHAPVQICSAQTLDRRGWPNVDLVVIDEAHLRFKVYRDWMASDECAKVKFIGLSATPWSKGLGKQFDALIKGPSTAEMIELGYLSPFKVIAPTHPDLSGIDVKDTPHGRDYNEGQLAALMSQPKLIADAVEAWKQFSGGRPTLGFSVNRAHAAEVCKSFNDAGIAWGYVDANTPREERDKMLRMVEAGELKGIESIGTMTTGVDADIRCLSLKRPTRSEILWCQMIGRALRIAEGKDYAVLVDHTDGHTSPHLGFVTDIDHDELDDGKPRKPSSSEAREKVEKLPRQCSECPGLIPPNTNQCPCCGAESRRPSNVVVERGELAELIPGAKKAKLKRAAKESVADFLKRHDRDALHAQLMWIADERGKSPGWVSANFYDLHGSWPRGYSFTRKDEPSTTLRNWVRSRDIAWARSQPKREEAV